MLATSNFKFREFFVMICLYEIQYNQKLQLFLRMIIRVVNGGQAHEFEEENLEDCSLTRLKNKIQQKFTNLPYIYTLNYLARDKEPLRLKNQSDYQKLFELTSKQMNDNPLSKLKNEKKMIKLIVFAKSGEQTGEDISNLGVKDLKTITEKLESMLLEGEKQDNNQYQKTQELDLDKICEKVKNLKLLQEQNQVKEEQSSDDMKQESEKNQKPKPKKRQYMEDIDKKDQSSDSEQDEDDDDDPSKPVHQGVQCSHCKRFPIKGIRWKCSICSDYESCENCQFMDLHNSLHPLLKIKVPIPQKGNRVQKITNGKQTKLQKKEKKRKQKQKLTDNLLNNEALQILVISRASALCDILMTDYQKCFKLVLKNPMKSQSQLIDIYFQKFKSVHT